MNQRPSEHADTPCSDPETERAQAAAAAVAQVRNGMALGLGTGRTAEAFLESLASRIEREGLEVVGVPTSQRTAERARQLKITLTDLEAHPELDMTIDGADEIDPELRLIKGGGGALLREKIVASASRDMLVVADEAKCVEMLGAFPLPIEIVPFGMAATLVQLERAIASAGAGGPLRLRKHDGRPFVTDNGNHIVDASLERIAEPDRLAHEIARIPGVVEHGLFIDLASCAYVAGPAGLRRLARQS